MWSRTPTPPPPADEGAQVKHDEHGNTVIIVMSDDDQGDAGIVFGNPSAGQWSPETKGYGRVMDPAPLAGMLNDLVSAQAAAQATPARMRDRQKTLLGQTNTSARVLQAAEAAGPPRPTGRASRAQPTSDSGVGGHSGEPG